MNCPKCGAAQDAGRDECSACGIVFARWQPRVPRQPTLSTPIEEPPKRIPVPLLIVGLFFLIVAGLIWTKHSREARAKLNPDDILNDINNKGAVLRNDLRKSQDAMLKAQARAAMTATAINPPSLPSGLDEQRVMNEIEQCSYFSEPVVVSIPKDFQVNLYGFTAADYPALPIAAIDHLVELDPPFNVSNAPMYRDPTNPGQHIQVKLTNDTYSKVNVHDDATVYHFDLGRRRVTIKQVYPQTSDSFVTVGFRWDFDQSAGARLAPEREQREGGITLQRTSSGWTREQIWRNERGGSTGVPCQ